MLQPRLLIALGLTLMLSGCNHSNSEENAESGGRAAQQGQAAATSPTPSNGMDAARQAGPGWGHPNASGKAQEQHDGNSN